MSSLLRQSDGDMEASLVLTMRMTTSSNRWNSIVSVLFAYGQIDCVNKQSARIHHKRRPAHSASSTYIARGRSAFGWFLRSKLTPYTPHTHFLKWCWFHQHKRVLADGCVWVDQRDGSKNRHNLRASSKRKEKGTTRTRKQQNYCQWVTTFSTGSRQREMVTRKN